MKTTKRIWQGFRGAARGKSHAVILKSQRFGVSLAVLLAVLTPGPARSLVKDCSFTPASGTCCAKCTTWPDGTGYPSTPNEETGTNLYRLDKPEPSHYAILALYEYCSVFGGTPASLTFDQKIAAVALYVTNHMSWRSDDDNIKAFKAMGYGAYNPQPGDFPQPADLTLKISGIVNNTAPNDDFQGDCEDFAILRAALLRAAPICLPPAAIWDAIDGAVTHEYNVVQYGNAYRIMDYGTIDRWIPTHTWDAHKSYFGWNERNTPRGWSAIQNAYLKGQTNNCATGTLCSTWSFSTYYKDKCPCP